MNFMDLLSIIAAVMAVSAMALFFLVPRICYGLGFRDSYRFYCNHRYQVFVYAHKRFQKVMSGKMSYERFCRDIKEIYDKDNFDAVRNNATYNNKVRADLVFLAEAVDNEEFIRRVFSISVLSFEKFEELESEMNTQSTNAGVRPSPVCRAIPSRGPKSKLTADERRAPGSFDTLILNAGKSGAIKDWITSKLSTINTGQEYSALVFALKGFGGVHFSSTVELYDCINSTFEPGINVQYTALMEQMKAYSNEECNDDILDRISNLVKTYSNELKRIKP